MKQTIFSFFAVIFIYSFFFQEKKEASEATPPSKPMILLDDTRQIQYADSSDFYNIDLYAQYQEELSQECL